MRLKEFFILPILLLYSSYSFASNYHLPVEKYKLPNGLTVILEEDYTSDLVAIQLWVRIGSSYEGRFLGSGVAHLVEHMVFKRGSAWGGGSMRIAKELQRLGGELDASTGKEYTEFSIIINKDNLQKAMELIYDIITKAEFSEKELEKEKQVVIHEMEAIEDDPYKFLVQEFFKASFQGHPYGEPVIGNRSLFNKINRSTILEYYKFQYIPRNMVLVIVGNFKTKEVRPLIDRLWGNIPDISSVQDYIPEKPLVKGPTRRIIQKGVSSSYIIVGFYGPPIGSQDIYPMDLLAEILGGGKESRLRKRLQDRLGFVSNIEAWSYTGQFTGIWAVNASLAMSDWGVVLKNILKEVYRTRLDPVSEEELTRAKKRITCNYLSSLETIEGRARDLGSNEIYTRNPLFTQSYIRGIMGVTSEDIRKVARRYFNSDALTITILAPIQSKRMPSAIKEVGEGIERLKLENGMRILIKEDRRLPLVTIRLCARGGLLEESKPGLSYFVSQLWLKEKSDLVKNIELIGGSISTYSGNNSIGFSIRVFKEDVTIALEAVNKLIKDLTITGKRMQLVRDIQLAQIKQEEDTPYGFAFKKAKEIFFGSHPYRNSILGTNESVRSITEADVKDFFDRYITPSNIVISIFGDVDREYMRGRILHILGGKASNILPPERGWTSYIVPKVEKKVIPRQTEQAIIILVYPSVNIYSRDRYAMELLAQVFSGQAGRLYESIRERQGLSYSIGALNIIGIEPGLFMFYIATTPDNVEKAQVLLFKEVKRLKEEGISREELERVKRYYLTQVQKEWESSDGLSLEVALDELYGLGWDYYKRYLDGIEGVTTEDIKHISKEYFKDDWYTLVVVGPVDSGK